MSNFHDPFRQVSYLQQCLSQDKKALGLFIGAGCPLSVKSADGEVLIPDILGITQYVCGKLAESSALKQVQKNCLQDGCEAANIEDLLSHIRALKTVAGTDAVRGLKADDLDKIDEEICREIHELVNKALPNSDTSYHRVAAWMDAGIRTLPVEVFTTNYDLLMEQALEDLRVPYFDGFTGVRKPFFDLRAMEEDQLPARWARLWKLHGSINWFQDSKGAVFRGGNNEDGAIRVIHPSHLKYDESRRMPYLAMIDRLRSFLKQASSVLVICGYSFRDDHINEVIVQGLQANPTAIAFALLFGKIEQYSKAILLAQDRSNLSLLAQDQAIIGTRRNEWLKRSSDLVDESLSRWIMWADGDQKVEKPTKRAELTLGNFKVFGDFLQELIGSNWQPVKESNAE
ncbi:MAG: SIR2 family protein [Pseudomonadota bacterium]